ncbi:sensor histidine kinase [Brevibacterium spongiae]|uniref:histidine kinase n=1 Tax=Brevibacterium spongiae TaxID=2909672 RepID=A0ABY5SLN4_9MICO|nr:histidine kinase [Brevibacterium spongiae]UVI35075.1 histidine kinase [Brevibacterium spongiae]
MSLTCLWLSLVTLAMLTRAATGVGSIALIVVLAAANILVPTPMSDGATFALAVFALVIAAIAIGLMLRSNDRTLIEKQATATEAERRRIATELHDLIAHEVTGIVVLAQAAGRSDNDALRTTALTKIEDAGTRALDEIRRLVSASRTQNLDSETVTRTPVAAGPQALRDRVTAFGETAHITIEIPSEVNGEVWPVLDRVLVESLTNVRRHAGADAEVTVTLTTDPTSQATLLMTVTNGPGSGGIGAGSGTGLRSLQARVGHLGGRIEAGPEPGGGWSVRARVPTDHDHQQAGEGR